jgi:hypothetical protein
MTLPFTGTQIIVPNATALAGAPSVENDVIDGAMATLGSYIFAYIRAKDWATPAASGLVDLTGNPITTQHTGETYTSSDAAFGGLPSVNCAACSDTPYVVTNRGAAPPGAFTFLAAMEITASQASGKVHCLISQTEGVATLGFTIYNNQTASGTGAVQGPGGTNQTITGLPVQGTPSIFVCSYDPTTKIARAGLNGLPTNSITYSGSGPVPGSTDVFRLFGNVGDNNDNTLGKFETMAIFNAAAGAGYAIDPLLSALITSMRGVYGF